MLKFLRNPRNKRRIFLVLAVLILPPFLFWGISLSDKKTSGAATLGRIDDRKVSLQDYLASYKAVQHHLALFYGDQRDSMQNRINLKGEAWDRLLLLHNAKKENIKVSDVEVVDWITTQPLFARDGRFDEKFYKLYVQNYLRTSEREFEEEVRGILTIGKLQKKIASKTSLADEELKERYVREHGERTLQVAVITAESQSAGIEVTDKDIERIFEVVKDKLTTREKVRIQYLFVPNEAAEPQKRALEATGTLDAISKEFGLTPKETTPFASNEAVPEIGLYRDLLDASFKLPKNGESQWIKVDKGSYKIRVEDKEPERPMTMEESRDELKQIIKKQKATEAAMKKLEELKKKMGADFEKTLKAENIEVKTIENFKTGVYVPGVGPFETVQPAVSGLKVGEVSGAFAVPTGGALAKVLKDSPLDEKKFETEKEAYRKKIIDQKTEIEMNELMERLRNRLTMNLELMKSIFPEDA